MTRARGLLSMVLTAALSNTGCQRKHIPIPGVPPTAAAAVPTSNKREPVDPALLKEGMRVMLPRVGAQRDGFGAITPNEHSRFFMHPGDKTSAILEFETKGLTSLTLQPFIEDFSTNYDCTANPQAGVVHLTYSVDCRLHNEITVDRNYAELVDVDVANSAHLRLEVDNGNGVTFCDWASIGFLNVK